MQESLEKEDLDLWAWQCINGWAKKRKFNAIFDEIDYFELSKWFLWDKVGQALRSNNIHETATIKYNKLTRLSYAKGWFAHLKKFMEKETGIKKKDIDRPLIWVPYLSPRLKAIVETLLEKTNYFVGIEFNNTEATIKSNFRVTKTKPLKKIPLKFLESLHFNIIEGLKNLGIHLSHENVSLLFKEILELSKEIQRAETVLNFHKPDLILVHADNHPPHQIYVLLGKKMGIPVLMIQHGLDCEHHYLDEAYASHIAVWGNERKVRYQNKSKHHSIIKITGNPEYDSIKEIPNKIQREGNYWLWATRPHSRKKCYAPSRHEDEGVEILKALLNILEQYPSELLVVKPHPYDTKEKYIDLIDKLKYKNPVLISDQPLFQLFPNAKLVLTEDSTAGLEALFFRKPLIHVHFTLSPPVIPYIEDNVAIQAFNQGELDLAIKKILKLEYSEDELLAAQNIFINDFAGSMDNCSHIRVVEFVNEIIHAG